MNGHCYRFRGVNGCALWAFWSYLCWFTLRSIESIYKLHEWNISNWSFMNVMGIFKTSLAPGGGTSPAVSVSCQLGRCRKACPSTEPSESWGIMLGPRGQKGSPSRSDEPLGHICQKCPSSLPPQHSHQAKQEKIQGWSKNRFMTFFLTVGHSI